MAKVSGQDKLLQELKRVGTTSMKQAYSNAMTDMLLTVKGKSMKRTPVDTGFLKSATFIKQFRTTKMGSKGMVYNTANYAKYVHENLNASHTEGQQAKFLETAVQEVSKDAEEILSYYVRKVLS